MPTNGPYGIPEVGSLDIMMGQERLRYHLMLYPDVRPPELMFTDVRRLERTARYLGIEIATSISPRRWILIADAVPPIPDMVGGGVIVAER